MTLLLKTDIEKKVRANITGNLARVGGKVEQVVSYKNCIVEDINIANRRSCKFGSSTIGKLRYCFDLLEQEIRFWRKGYRAIRDRKTLFIDLHDALSCKHLKKKYDGVLSSHVIEHSYNAIWFLLNMHFLVRERGYHFHAIPCYRYTFDQFRTPTTLKHFIDDFKNITTKNDLKHHAREHHESALQWDKVRGAEKPKFPRIHCHVFDEHNTKELFEFIFEDVTVDIIKKGEFRDVLVMCRNTLNPVFRKKFAEVFSSYQYPL